MYEASLGGQKFNYLPNDISADDEPTNKFLMLELFQEAGVRVMAVDNGKEAVAACRAEFFDLILMDIQMPILNGLEATRQIREFEVGTGRHTPIIAMTAHAMEGDRESCIAAGTLD